MWWNSDLSKSPKLFKTELRSKLDKLIMSSALLTEAGTHLS